MTSPTKGRCGRAASRRDVVDFRSYTPQYAGHHQKALAATSKPQSRAAPGSRQRSASLSSAAKWIVHGSSPSSRGSATTPTANGTSSARRTSSKPNPVAEAGSSPRIEPTPGVAYPSIPTATTRGPLRTTPPRLRATGPMDEPTSSACAAGTAQRGSCREGPWLRSRSWVFRAPRSTSRRRSPGAGCAVATLQPKARGRNHDPRCREPSR